jgi:hypothetical protein
MTGYKYIVSILIIVYYNNVILVTIISKLYIIQGTKTINEITIGNNIVHENVINWSKRILGKEALTHIKVKINIQDFIPIVKP